MEVQLYYVGPLLAVDNLQLQKVTDILAYFRVELSNKRYHYFNIAVQTVKKLFGN